MTITVSFIILAVLAIAYAFCSIVAQINAVSSVSRTRAQRVNNADLMHVYSVRDMRESSDYDSMTQHAVLIAPLQSSTKVSVN
jgi:hypothetical protein